MLSATPLKVKTPESDSTSDADASFFQALYNSFFCSSDGSD
jgi:hypothetical protein